MTNKGPMSERGRHRVLSAASQVETKNLREAAILGGIVRCAIDNRRFNPKYVEHYVPQILVAMSSTIRSHIPPCNWPDLRPPSRAEIAVMVQEFKRHYDPPEHDHELVDA